jgi:hypothetical protein
VSYTVLYSIGDAGFRHARVDSPAEPDEDLAAQLVTARLAAEGETTGGDIRIHRINPA